MKLDRFIHRPVLSTVISIIIVILGILGLVSLPVTQYPDIAPPTVRVSTSYTGANAQTVLNSVIAPLEEEINGVENMMYMTSTASNTGEASIEVYFKQGTDPDMAAVNVQNRVAKAQGLLPSEVTRVGVITSKRQTSMLLAFSVYSSDDKYDEVFLENYIKINVIPLVQRVPGVGDAMVMGADYAMRIWLKPDVMAQYMLMPSDITAVLAEQNIEAAPGQFGEHGDQSFQYIMRYKGRLQTPEDFEDIVIKATPDGKVLKLKDVARLEMGSISYGFGTRSNAHPGISAMVFQTAGSNATEIINNIKEILAEVSKDFPPGVKYDILLDSNDFLFASIHEVIKTLVEAFILVFLVVFIFLQDFRSTLIPAIAIPVALIGTFFFLYLIGFSINLLTLCALVLAIAIVVDDAIVVVEDCSRLVDKGDMTRHQAATQAMKELTGPVVGEVLVLLSVFIPTAFVSGITGQLYKQFALSIAVSTAFSGFNALTLTPALCALFLTPRKETKFFLYRWFNAGWAKVESLYNKIVGVMLNHAAISLLIFLFLAGLAFWGFVKWPTSYIPSEDMGYFITSVQLPTGASLERTEKITNGLADEIRKIDGVKDVMTISGFSIMGGGAASNASTVMVMLEPWKERGRKESVDNIMEEVGALGEKFQGAVIFAVNPPAIPGLGMSAGLEMNILDINSLGATEMLKAIDDLRQAVDKDPRLASLTTMYQGVVPQYQVSIHRDKALTYGLEMSDIFQTLSGYMGGNYVNDFVEFNRVYQVRLQGDPQARGNIEDVLRLSVRNSNGEMVPFAAFSTIEPVMGQASVNRYNMYESASVTVTPAKGVSSSEGIEAMEQLFDKTLGKNYSYAWTGMAYQETQSGTTITFVFIFAIIMTILVLAAQYESWTDPIAVILATPIAILGTILGCICMSQSISIYTQIGLILLIGMSAKNAILIVEYAMDFRKSGQPVKKAAHDAGVIRFRPIMMTALAFVFGVMPMMFATGAGANSRIELGTAVVFGMAMNALIGTLFVPTFWDLMQRINEKYLSGLFKDPAPAGDKSGTESSPGI